MTELLSEPETWVAIAFLIFLGLLYKLGAPGMVFKALDDRSARIRAQLDEAVRLRQEAQDVLAQYQRRQAEAEKAADAILHNATIEAERLATEARTKVEEFIARRTRMAETRIAQAEAQAQADVRAAAADLAVSAAQSLLVKTTRGQAAERLIDRGIADLRAKLN